MKTTNLIRSCLNSHTQRRVRARGLQEVARIPIFCRPGPLTGRLFKQALIVCTALGIFATSLHAQIQQAWVAHYNNGITNGTHQALKMALDATGNIYVTGFSQNINSNLGYVTIKYAPNGTQLWASRYDSTNYPSATPSALCWTTAITSS